MNPIESNGNELTRRDFMKKSALTVGAITLLGAGIGLANVGSGSSWWDMKCKVPDDDAMSVSTNIAVVGPPGEFTATFDLALYTDKAKDLTDDDGYNDKAVVHDFTFQISNGNASGTVLGNSKYDVQCDLNTGSITSNYNAISSNPVGDNSITDTYTVDNKFSVDLTINILRNQGASDITTKIFALAKWKEIANPGNKGYLRLPAGEGETIEITNSFESHIHP